jgi:hypothetical protein
MFVLAFGWIVVLHSPSLRARLVNMLNSTGWNGLTDAGWIGDRRKIGVGRADSQLSTLHEPASPMSAASTA